MNDISTSEIARMRWHAEQGMFSNCKIGTPVVTPPNPTPSAWTWGEAISCGVAVANGSEATDGSGAGIVDVIIRLPISTEITTENRIQVTHKFRVPLDEPEIYAVVGEPSVTLLCKTIRAKRITGASGT